MSIFYPLMVLVLVHLGATSYRPGLYTTCLSCPSVSHPHECKIFAEVWPHERCATYVILLINGSTVYAFSYESAADCIHSDSLVSIHNRKRRMSITDISLCHECCAENFCNRKLCGIPESNNTNLACLAGKEVTGLPFDTLLTFCNAGQQCYAGRVVHHGSRRPNQLDYTNYANYGCASQVMCDQLDSPNVQKSTHCQGCCSQDACNAQICQAQATTTPGMDTTQGATTYKDCWDLRSRGDFTETGIYDIYPPPAHSHLRVRCDMTTDGGGWIILQRRYDGSVNFARTFQEYEGGFGNVTSEYWVGLEWIHILTTQEVIQLRVDLCTFDSQAGYVVYDGFTIANQSDTYRQQTGTASAVHASNSLEYSNNRVFEATGRCGTRWRGGWWHQADCYSVNLNGGRYNGGPGNGIVWGNFGGSGYPSLRSSEMKLRPINAPGDPSRSYTCHL